MTPIYEFGFGLSYTTFSYSNLQITPVSAPAYTPASGQTLPAPTYGSISNNTADYLFPADFYQIPAYIYPFLNHSTLAAASQDPQYGINYTFPAGSSDSSAQPILPAGGAPGGNPRLYDTLYTISCTVTNTGNLTGQEVPQLYVSLGGPNDPVRVLRQFDKFEIEAGSSGTFVANLTRRDISNWDTVAQDWVVSEYEKSVYVGSSSRKLPLSGVLPDVMVSGGGGGNNATATYMTGYSAPTVVSQISDGQVQAGGARI